MLDNQKTRPAALDPERPEAELARQLLAAAAAEPVPDRLRSLALELEAALERRLRAAPVPADTPEPTVSPEAE